MAGTMDGEGRKLRRETTHASWSGFCHVCGREIIDEPVSRDADRHWVHEDCAD